MNRLPSTHKRLMLAVVALMSASGCDELPITFSREESAFGACEEVIREQLTTTSFDRLWANFTPRSKITKDEWASGLEQRATALRAIGDFGSNLIAYNLEKMASCARNGECDDFLPAPDDARDGPAAKGENDRPGNPLTYERSDIASQNQTGFVLIEYESINSFGATVRQFHFCRMTQSLNHFTKGNVWFHGPVSHEEGQAAKRLYEKL